MEVYLTSVSQNDMKVWLYQELDMEQLYGDIGMSIGMRHKYMHKPKLSEAEPSVHLHISIVYGIRHGTGSQGRALGIGWM